MQMKKIPCFLSILFLLSFISCRKDFTTFEKNEVVFQLTFPENFNPQRLPEHVNVAIKNNISGEVHNALSDASGKVSLSLVTGSYSLTASRSYSPVESQVLIGTTQESFVNASVTPILIQGALQLDVPLQGSLASGLVIREYYYNGVPSFYFYDLFVEIYNNSTETIQLDSLYLGNTKSASSSAYGFLGQKEAVYLAQVWMIPGDGTEHSLAPGESFVIAMDGINHQSDPNGNPNSPVNLGTGVADFETYWPYLNRDADAPDVPNLFHAYYNTTTANDWLPGVAGTGLVLFRTKDLANLPVFTEPGTTSTNQFKGIPAVDILDAVDCVSNTTITADKKRLPTTVDAGMITVGANYTGKSVRRKIREVVNGQTIFMDTNNSSLDFEINNTPSPRKWN